jgi:NADPH:quinone reductase-like Zn-dependent oxidoreductase
VLVDDGRDSARLAAAVAEATGNAAIRLGLDAVGGTATDGLAATLGDGGVIANYGLLSGAACQIDPFHLVFRGIRLQGFWLAQYARTQGAAAMRALFADLIGLVAAGEIRVQVEARYPFARIGEALGHAARPGRSGKILLTP